MTAELEQHKETLRALEERAKNKSQIESAFIKAARERNEALLSLFNAYRTEIQKINTSQNELRIEIEFKGDRDSFKIQMKSDFRGTGVSDTKYQQLCDRFIDYTALVEDWILHDGAAVREILSPNEYAKVEAKLKEQYIHLSEYLFAWRFRASKVSSLMSCSILQASSTAVFLSTPRRTRKSVSVVCLS